MKQRVKNQYVLIYDKDKNVHVNQFIEDALIETNHSIIATSFLSKIPIDLLPEKPVKSEEIEPDKIFRTGDNIYCKTVKTVETSVLKTDTLVK